MALYLLSAQVNVVCLIFGAGQAVCIEFFSEHSCLLRLETTLTSVAGLKETTLYTTAG